MREIFIMMEWNQTLQADRRDIVACTQNFLSVNLLKTMRSQGRCLSEFFGRHLEIDRNWLHSCARKNKIVIDWAEIWCKY